MERNLNRVWSTSSIRQPISIDGSKIFRVKHAEEIEKSVAVELFPCRPCNYVRDSRHRMQNNLLRSLGASKSWQHPSLPPAATVAPDINITRRRSTTPYRYYKSANHRFTGEVPIYQLFCIQKY